MPMCTTTSFHAVHVHCTCKLNVREKYWRRINTAYISGAPWKVVQVYMSYTYTSPPPSTTEISDIMFLSLDHIV